MITAPGTPSPDPSDTSVVGAPETLTTTVQDPKHPEAPWIVTTTRGPGEDLVAWFKRHQAIITKLQHFLKDV